MKGLIDDHLGNLSRLAADIGVSRPTLYKWLALLDLLEYAGVDSKDGSDTVDVVDDVYSKPRKPLVDKYSTQKYVKPRSEQPGSLPPVSSAASKSERPQQDLRVQRSVLVHDSLWSWAKHHSVDTKKSISDIVEEALNLYRQQDGAKDRLLVGKHDEDE